ncbi:MAG: quinolinate synthase NadA [Candidatus Omnitrophota bacterium]
MTAQELYQKLKPIQEKTTCRQYSLEECERYIPLIKRINTLKHEQNAVILAHTYVTPEIIYGVADYVGDSYGLSKDALATKAEKIIFAAVRFMGETAKILNPDKEIIVPARDPGCTLADSITGEQVSRLRKQYPDHTFVCYINTTVDVKAECDVCVTSGNVYRIVEKIPNDKIFFLPDKYMAQNLRDDFKKRGIKKEILSHEGSCTVHEEIEAEEIEKIRRQYPGILVAAHPECRPEVCTRADFIGSTAQMIDYVRHSDHDQFFLLTECGLAHRIKIEHPELDLLGSCRICEYMKSNSLEDILRVMTDPQPSEIITVSDGQRHKALRSLDAMFRYAE